MQHGIASEIAKSISATHIGMMLLVPNISSLPSYFSDSVRSSEIIWSIAFVKTYVPKVSLQIKYAEICGVFHESQKEFQPAPA